MHKICQRNNKIRAEMDNLIIKQGRLTEPQRKEFLTKLKNLKKELETIGD